MVENIMRIAIILLNLMAIPLLYELIIGVAKEHLDKKTNDGFVSIVLILTFAMLLVVSIMNVFVSVVGMWSGNKMIHPGDLSRVRSLLVSLANFSVSYLFHRLFANSRR